MAKYKGPCASAAEACLPGAVGEPAVRRRVASACSLGSVFYRFRLSLSASSQICQYGRSAFYVVPDLDLQIGRCIQHHIHTRPKFNQANALAAFYTITDLHIANDAARQ